jgi:hypothetical protein
MDCRLSSEPSLQKKEPSPHASGEPSLQHLKVFDYELIGIIVI